MARYTGSEGARALIQIKLAAPAIPYCGSGKERKSAANEYSGRSRKTATPQGIAA